MPGVDTYTTLYNSCDWPIGQEDTTNTGAYYLLHGSSNGFDKESSPGWPCRSVSLVGTHTNHPHRHHVYVANYPLDK